MSSSSLPARPALLRRARVLEWLTLLWNVAEGVIAIAAGIASGSVALLGFGLDSVVECASAGVLLWRLHAEDEATPAPVIERLERRARRLVAGSLVLLALYVAGDAAWSLLQREEPRPSVVGLVVPAVSVLVMAWLARAKRRLAIALGSGALAADAFQTTACWWLSLVTLAGVGLNAAFGWWWADPVAALVIAVLIGVEARQAFKGEGCCAGACHGPAPPAI